MAKVGHPRSKSLTGSHGNPFCVLPKMSKKSWTLELGTVFSNHGVQFRVWAPKVDSASLVVGEDSRKIQMVPERNGYFTTFLDDIEPGTRYFYLLNGDQLRSDPVSRSQPDGVHGPFQVIDPSEFKWQDEGWRGIPTEEMMIYEIHTGTFTHKGTFVKSYFLSNA